MASTSIIVGNQSEFHHLIEKNDSHESQHGVSYLSPDRRRYEAFGGNFSTSQFDQGSFQVDCRSIPWQESNCYNGVTQQNALQLCPRSNLSPSDPILNQPDPANHDVSYHQPPISRIIDREYSSECNSKNHFVSHYKPEHRNSNSSSLSSSTLQPANPSSDDLRTSQMNIRNIISSNTQPNESLNIYPDRHTGSTKKRRTRTSFSPDQKRELTNRFESNPYIKSSERRALAAKLGLPDRVVKNYFQNRRQKDKRLKRSENFYKHGGANFY